MNAYSAHITTDYSNPWVAWLDFCQVLHAWQMEWYHMWAHHCLPPHYAAHPHVGHHQLEIPDSLETAIAPELFA